MSTITALRASQRVVGSWTKSAPSLGGTASDLLDAIDSAGTAKWLNPAPVSNDCLEFYEIDLTSLNSGNPVTVISMRMDFSWRHDKLSTTTGTWICNTAALDANDALVRGPDDSRIWYNSTLAATYDYGLGYTTRPKRYTTADGRNWSEFDRVGFTIESIWGNGTGEIRVYDVQVYVEWESGGDGISDAVTATLTAPTGSPSWGGAVTAQWTYANTAGVPQTHWEIEVTADAATPGTGVEVYGTGKVAGESTRSHTLTEPLDPGAYDMHVRAWSTTAAGQVIRSNWDTEGFTVPEGSNVSGEETPSAPGSLTLDWVPPDATLLAYQAEPRPSGWRYWDSVQMQLSADSSEYATAGSGVETTTPFEELLASHDATYVLICAEDIVAGTEVWPVRHPAGVADGTFTTTGNDSRVLDWPGDHFLWLPGVDDNSMQAASVSMASSSQVDVAFDVDLEDIAADCRILNVSSTGPFVDAVDTGSGLSVAVFDGTNTVSWTASAANLGIGSIFGSRIQVWVTIDLSTDDAEFYVRDFIAPGLTVDTDQGWTLAYTDTTPSTASTGSRSSGTATVVVGENPSATNPCRGRIYEVVCWSGVGLTKEAHFFPADVGAVDHSEPNAGYSGWSDDLAYSWTLNQEDNVEANAVAQVVTSGVYLTTKADSTDVPVFADAAIRAKFAGITASGGELTVISAVRPDLAGASALQAIWSTEVNTSESFSLRLSSTSGQVNFRVEGATAGVTEAGGNAVDGNQLVVATVVDSGTAKVWDSVSGTLTAGSSIAGVGVLPTPGNLTLGARAETPTAFDFAGTYSMVAIVQKALTELEIEAVRDSFLAGRRFFRRWELVDQPPHHASVLYRARGVNAAGSRASAWTYTTLSTTGSEGWFMICCETGAILQPVVIGVTREDPEAVQVIDQLPPSDKAVVISSGDQATRLELTFRTMSKSERLGLTEYLAGGGPWRLINSLGEEWTVRRAGGITPVWVRAMPTATESTGLRDLYETTVPFVEVDA